MKEYVDKTDIDDVDQNKMGDFYALKNSTHTDLEEVKAEFIYENPFDIPEHIKKIIDDCDGRKLYFDGPSSVISNQEFPKVMAYIAEKLPNLEELSFENIGLTSLSGIEKLANLKNLKILYLRFNKLTSLSGIEKLTNIKKLYCSHNQLTSIVEVENLKNLEIFHCGDNQLISLKGIEKLDNLSSIDCFLNQLTSLVEVANLINLKTFGCSGNKLTSLAGLEKLVELNTFDCSLNKLSSLTELGNLPGLLIFNCSSNQLTSLVGVENLPNLEVLSCGDNQLTSLRGIESLIHLKQLVCSRNQLTSLEGLENLTNVLEIYCAENKLISLTALKNLPNLIGIDVTQNLLETPRIYSLPERVRMAYNHYSYSSDVIIAAQNISRTQYQNRAINDPLMFIKLLEDSRKAHDKHSDTKALRDNNNPTSRKIGIKTTVPERSTIIEHLDANQLICLLDKGSQEVLSGYESTFAYIFNAYCKKDPNFSKLEQLSGQKLWNITSTVSQLSQRYLDLGKKGGYIAINLQKFFMAIESKMGKITHDSVFTIDTTISFLLPIIQLYATSRNNKKLKDIKNILNSFLVKFAQSISKNYVPEMKLLTESESKPGFFRRLYEKIFGNQKKDEYIGSKLLDTKKKLENYHLSGLILYQLASIDKDLSVDDKNQSITFNETDASDYKLETDHLQTLSFDRTSENPGITNMFFDNNEDGKASFDHWLTTMGVNISNQKTNTRGGIGYTLHEVSPPGKPKESYYEISVSYQGSILHKIYANHPLRPEGTHYFPKNADIVVDRGHAGGEEAGLAAIGENTKLVLVGSCGGYAKLADALNANPNIQYIGTTGTGDMSVNDPIYMSVLEAGCKKQTIHRNGWEPNKNYIAEKDKYETDRPSYQLPPQQLGSAMKQKYNDLVPEG